MSFDDIFATANWTWGRDHAQCRRCGFRIWINDATTAADLGVAQERHACQGPNTTLIVKGINVETKMYQTAPFPAELRDMVATVTYRRGWTFTMDDFDRGQGSAGLTLTIAVITKDTYSGEPILVYHLFPVPPAAYDMRSWRRWLFDQIMLVERHEAMEFFQLDQVRPYAPSHGPGNDPYMIREVGTDEDQRTSFRGELT